jgi:hypothetical protein
MTRKKPNKKQDKNAIRKTCEKKQHSTVRKPGLPPARSPEITQSRPHGHKFSQVRGNPIRPAMTQSRSRRKGKTDNEIGPRVRLDSRVANSQSPLRVHSVDLFQASSSSLEDLWLVLSQLVIVSWKSLQCAVLLRRSTRAFLCARQ